MSNGKKYYVKEAGFDNLMNAGILRSQNESILQDLNFESIDFSNSSSLIHRVKSWQKMLSWSSRLNPEDLVIFHFPFHSRKNKQLLRLLSKKNIPVAVIIVDIDGLRDNDATLLKTELNLLQQSRWIIAHNDAMKHFLEQRLNSKEIKSIGIFDYKSPGSFAAAGLQAPVCFAGNIEKSGFLYLIKDVDVNIYGLGFDKSKSNDHLFYKGAFDAGTLPSKLEGSFGLVWDGNDINRCDPYLQYNNPHKLSLYLAAGMPVIVWDKSAIAELVNQQNIGFTISSLTDLKSRLNSITTTAYQQMQQNAVNLGKKIRQGFFLKQIMQELIEQ